VVSHGWGINGWCATLFFFCLWFVKKAQSKFSLNIFDFPLFIFASFPRLFIIAESKKLVFLYTRQKRVPFCNISSSVSFVFSFHGTSELRKHKRMAELLSMNHHRHRE